MLRKVFNTVLAVSVLASPVAAHAQTVHRPDASITLDNNKNCIIRKKDGSMNIIFYADGRSSFQSTKRNIEITLDAQGNPDLSNPSLTEGQKSGLVFTGTLLKPLIAEGRAGCAKTFPGKTRW